MIALGYALAALIGLSLGLLGGGGSILTVPILVYVLGFAPKPAIAASLLVVGATSLVGALGHWRAGNVRLRTAAAFGAVTIVGAFAGARLAALLSGSVQLAIFAVVMLAAALSMFRRRAGAGGEGEGAGRMHPALLAGVGLGVGVLTGVVGVGGGFLIVPALVLLAHVPMKQAVGTSLLVIALNSGAGFAGYLGQVPVDWPFLLGFTAIAIGGIVLGTHLVRFVSQAALQRAFAVFLLLMGGFILYQNRGVFLPGVDAPARAAAAQH